MTDPSPKSGRKSRCDAGVWSSFRSVLAASGDSFFSSRDLQYRFEKHTQIRYSRSHFLSLLRSRLSLYLYKPQPRDYRQNPEALFQLQQRIDATLDALKIMGKNVEGFSIGFADESAAQLYGNRVRFWALEPSLIQKINSTRGSRKFFGYYAVKGECILEEMKGCKTEDMRGLIDKIRAANLQYNGIILFWDNAATHKKVEQYAYNQGVYIIPLPTYSPNLNPIERIWKEVKREISQQGFIKNFEQLGQFFRQSFETLKVQLSFADNWLKENQSILSLISTKNE